MKFAKIPHLAGIASVFHVYARAGDCYAFALMRMDHAVLFYGPLFQHEGSPPRHSSWCTLPCGELDFNDVIMSMDSKTLGDLLGGEDLLSEIREDVIPRLIEDVRAFYSNPPGTFVASPDNPGVFAVTSGDGPDEGLVRAVERFKEKRRGGS